MKKFKVGLQLYCVREAMNEDFEGTLQAVKDMGYDYVEFAGFYEKSAEEVKEILDRIGLTAISVHEGTQNFNEKGQAAIDYLKTIGVKYCAIPWYNKDEMENNWDAMIADFKNFSKALNAAGIKLLYHNHDFEFKKINGEYMMDRLYKECDSSVLNPEFDTCWVHYAGENPCKYIENYAGRVGVIHLKDFVCKNLGGGPVYALIDKDGKEQKSESREENGFEFRPVGYGIQNFPAILESAEKSGTEYVIVEQDSFVDITPLEAVKKSREYLKTLGL